MSLLQRRQLMRLLVFLAAIINVTESQFVGFFGFCAFYKYTKDWHILRNLARKQDPLEIQVRSYSNVH